MPKQLNEITIHFECLIGGLFEHDYAPAHAPDPCQDCQFHLGNARIQAGILIDQEEGRIIARDRSLLPATPAQEDGGLWQCAERDWRCGVRHGSYSAAANHIRRMGNAAGRNWTVIPWQPLTTRDPNDWYEDDEE